MNMEIHFAVLFRHRQPFSRPQIEAYKLERKSYKKKTSNEKRNYNEAIVQNAK